jgi:hypothetical protein
VAPGRQTRPELGLIQDVHPYHGTTLWLRATAGGQRCGSPGISPVSGECQPEGRLRTARWPVDLTKQKLRTFGIVQRYRQQVLTITVTGTARGFLSGLNHFLSIRAPLRHPRSIRLA